MKINLKQTKKLLFLLEKTLLRTHVKKTPYCKLYYSDSHKISYCSEYPNVTSRKAMSRDLNLYIPCSSTPHRKAKAV